VSDVDGDDCDAMTSEVARPNLETFTVHEVGGGEHQTFRRHDDAGPIEMAIDDDLHPRSLSTLIEVGDGCSSDCRGAEKDR